MRTMITNMAIKALYDRKGISALEYAILAAAILGAVSAGVTTLGGDISSLFNALETVVNNAVTAATGK